MTPHPTTRWEIKQQLISKPTRKLTSEKPAVTNLPKATKHPNNTTSSIVSNYTQLNMERAPYKAVQHKLLPNQQLGAKPPTSTSTKGVRRHTPNNHKSTLTTTAARKKLRTSTAIAPVQHLGTKNKIPTQLFAHKSPLNPTSEKERQHHHAIQKQQILDTIPPSIPVKDDIGKFGLMWPRGLASAHPAAPMLEEFSELGCPVSTGENWTTEQIIAALKRGPHISAKETKALQYLREETTEKLKGGY